MSEDELLDGLYPYRHSYPTHREIPETAVRREELAAAVGFMARQGDDQGDEGWVSGSLYSGDHEHYEFLGDIFFHFSHANILQRDMYPSATKFEGEISAMVLVRAGWLNLSLRTNRAALVRSVLEGVALNVRWLLTYYERFLKRPVGAIRALGAGSGPTSGARSSLQPTTAV